MPPPATNSRALKSVRPSLPLAGCRLRSGDVMNYVSLNNYDQAFKLISERAHFTPLFTYVKNYVMAKDLNFKPSPDDRARFYLASWK
jgi:peptide/nickel transport system substrate-binding protein